MPGVIYKKEREILEYIAQFQKQYSYSPKLAEIAHATGHKSISTIHSIIRSLVQKGYIQKVEGNTRVLKILDQKIVDAAIGLPPTIELPLMGFIAAGKPLEPHTDPNATFHVSASMITGKKIAYTLQVKGNSMVEDGILDGDYVVIERANDAQNGDIVVAIVDDSLATLKRFYNENGKVVLKPANSSMEPIYPNSLTVQGRVVGVIRKY
ncbi:MAG: transcriptional repressor LexA [Candidatus Levyibacteriota bacterium]|nr:MAG: transcriptional repressor LexA [Candidatus Levybacteria bacterium]